jgi:hypothetical protein
MSHLDQRLLLELDEHPHSTAAELHAHARLGETPLQSVRAWLRTHEGYLVIAELVGELRWRLAPRAQEYLAALD